MYLHFYSLRDIELATQLLLILFLLIYFIYVAYLFIHVSLYRIYTITTSKTLYGNYTYR